jgi:hypothetical protein
MAKIFTHHEVKYEDKFAIKRMATATDRERIGLVIIITRL